MNLPESAKLLLAASGGDTVKLFDISVEPQNPCVLTHSPSPGSRVNSVRWNHNNLVLASAGEDGRVSLWRKNGQSLWMVPAKNARGETVEPSESISTISFSNKGSRYLCSGGTGQVVRIWDLQNKRCVKWLKGHTDTITGAMYNCKDEHIASASRKGDIILHNLASGTKAAELRDPNGQVLGALDYSRMSRHLLVTAGDDGSIHMWDTTGRSPKASWLKQHSAPTSAVSFSPSNDKIIASVGLDMKLYTFDTGSKKPSSCIPYEAPFSSLAFTDDGLTLAAGTSTGQVVFYDVRGKPQPITVLRAYGNSEAVTNLCWQRSKPVMVNENNCSDDTVLLAGDVGDSVLMPDPLPSRASSSLSMPSMVSGTRNPIRTGSGDLFSFPAGSASSSLNLPASEETPLRSSLLTGGALTRLHAPRSYNFKDDMEVFSPLMEVQSITPSVDKLWDDRDVSKKDMDRKSSFFFPSRRFGLSDEGTNNEHPIFDWKTNSSAKQDDTASNYTQLASTPGSTRTDDASSITPPEAWGGERLSDKFSQHRHSINLPSRVATLTSTSLSSGLLLSGLQLQDGLLTNQSTSSLTSSLSLNSLRVRETLNHEGSIEAVSSPLGTKGITAQANLENLGLAPSHPRRFSSYAERIGATPSLSDTSSFPVGSQNLRKQEQKLGKSFSTACYQGLKFHQPQEQCPTIYKWWNDTFAKSSITVRLTAGKSFTLQLFQRTLEETLASFQKSIHDDMRNLHLEILRQFHMQEMEMSNSMGMLLENQAEIVKELQSLRKKHNSSVSCFESSREGSFF